jgi:hypothetical protein
MVVPSGEPLPNNPVRPRNPLPPPFCSRNLPNHPRFLQRSLFVERILTGLLILGVGVTVLFGILKLRRMQMDYTSRFPPKDEKSKDSK